MKIAFNLPVKVLFAFVFISSLCKAQYPSDSARISLLTLSPGEETYAAFGHSAIHVSDKRRGIDYVYNYGTFDFSTPNFYPKFGFGRLMYFLSISDYRDFFLAYSRWGQAMWKQELNLTNKEKWQLITNLQTNYQETNRFYRYGFFRDNCSTRIRDIIERSVDGKVIYDTTYIKKPESFRQLYSACLDFREPWALFGMDLLMGKGTDSIAGIRDYMFLPKNLMNLFATAKIVTTGGIRSLSKAPVELYPTTLTFPETSPIAKPVPVCWILFLLVCILSFWEYKKNRHFKLIDSVFFFLTGILGLLLTALMIASLHSELWSNMNIVWANPVNLIFAIGILFKSKPKWFQYLLKIYGIMLLMFIPVSFVVTQVFHPAIYPIIAILWVRTFKLLYANK